MTFQEKATTPILTSEHSPLELSWYEGELETCPDDRGQETLRYRHGFVFDSRGWALAFVSHPRRPDAFRPEFDLYWVELKYIGSSSRKSGLQIDGTDLNEISVDGSRHDWKAQLEHPYFEATPRDGKIQITLDLHSTATLLFRCLGRCLRMYAQRVKDSPAEPYQRLWEILAALDYDGFGAAYSVCAVNYTSALDKLLPMPFHGHWFNDLVAADKLDHPRRRRIDPFEQPELFKALIEQQKPSHESIIYLEEIAEDIRREAKDKTSGRSMSTIRRRIKALAVPMIKRLGQGPAISLADYQKHRLVFHQRPSRSSL